MKRMRQMKKINSERKILFQFIAVLIVSGLIGGLTGIFFTDHEKWIVYFASEFQQLMADLSPYLMTVIGIAGSVSYTHLNHIFYYADPFRNRRKS